MRANPSNERNSKRVRKAEPMSSKLNWGLALKSLQSIPQHNWKNSVCFIMGRKTICLYDSFFDGTAIVLSRNKTSSSKPPKWPILPNSRMGDLCAHSIWSYSPKDFKRNEELLCTELSHRFGVIGHTWNFTVQYRLLFSSQNEGHFSTCYL